MKRLNLMVVRSTAESQALSLRSESGHCTEMKRQIKTAGFRVGERVALVSAEELDALLGSHERRGE